MVLVSVLFVQERTPLPSVFRTWSAEPSVLGIVIAPVVTEPLVLTFVTEVLPSWMVLLAATLAPEPIAVALVRLFDATSAAAPIAVLSPPVVFVSKAAEPSATLLLPVCSLLKLHSQSLYYQCLTSIF